jgi:hypothetical protein
MSPYQNRCAIVKSDPFLEGALVGCQLFGTILYYFIMPTLAEPDLNRKKTTDDTDDTDF